MCQVNRCQVIWNGGSRIFSLRNILGNSLTYWWQQTNIISPNILKGRAAEKPVFLQLVEDDYLNLKISNFKILRVASPKRLLDNGQLTIHASR